MEISANEWGCIMQIKFKMPLIFPVIIATPWMAALPAEASELHGNTKVYDSLTLIARCFLFSVSEKAQNPKPLFHLTATTRFYAGISY